MSNRWRKLHYLVPEPQCEMIEDGNGVLQITEWNDSRTQPANNIIDAVTEQEVVDNELNNEAEKVMQVDKFRKLLLGIIFEQENRIRVLEGKAPIAKATYKMSIKKLYKTL